MPVSMVCESTANVNAALRESLAVNCSSAAVADESKIGNTSSPLTTAGGCTDDDVDTLQSKLVASAKRVLMTKIDYEEVNNYGQAVLDTLKSKYILLKPATTANGSNMDNGRKSPATLYNNNSNSANYATNGHCNANSTAETTNGSVNGGKVNGIGCNNNNNNNNNNNSGGSNSSLVKRPLTNSTELPQAKRILYTREQVRVGWKNSNRKWQVGSGFLNMGNTCYINSTLQALFHVPSMANWLISDTQHMERCEANDTSCIICAMVKTLQASQSSQSAIRPYFICSKLKLICKTMTIGRQEDAHEFLRYLVEAMERSYLQRFHNYKDLDQYSKETTPLNQILGGYLKSSVRCLACSHVSVTFQHFQDLLLDIRKGDTIEEAMDVYFARERLEDMGYKCESCKKKVSATKQFSLERAPIVLCIQLKRFSGLGTKLNKQINFKTRLDLSKYVSRKPSEQLSYRLVSMITHLGATQHCGHYTAIGLTESGNYYCYDDSAVRPISVQSVCNTSAYVIFYEIDNSSVSRLDLPSTQVSGANTKENYQKTNGHVLNGLTTSNTTLTSHPKSPQRLIGPQLPPGGLAAYKALPLAINNNSSNGSTAYTNGTSKLAVNRQHSIPTSNNSKLMIHFKNNNASVKTNATSISSDSTSTVTSSSNNNSNSNSTYSQNGVLAGTGKFQNSAHAKPELVGTTNKGKTVPITNGNESAFSDAEDEVSSSTAAHSTVRTPKPSLPSMPNLHDNSTTTTTTSAKTNGTKPKALLTLALKNSVKSLVPYDSESEEDASAEAKPLGRPHINGDHKIATKRRNSSSSDYSDTERCYGTKSNGVSLSQNQQSKGKLLKTDTIDEIFNYHKRNVSQSNQQQFISKQNNSLQQKQSKHVKQQSQHFFVSSTKSESDGDDTDSSLNQSKSSRRPFKRSQSTPPSPPVISTKTGIWQVTTIQPVTTCAESIAEQKTPKNLKNPFATKTPDICAKRPKMQNSEKQRSFNGNGYQHDAAHEGTVSELLKHSHRGYGAPVLTWNGTQNEVEKEVISEARIQRQHDWDEEEENEMDRGRQKKTMKTKINKEYNNYSQGYNPFQEQENPRRWKNSNGSGGGGGGNRLHNGPMRQQFQRNKFKFHRFNFNKNQRQKNGGGGNGNSSSHNHHSNNGHYQKRNT